MKYQLDCVIRSLILMTTLFYKAVISGAPNENIVQNPVQNHLNIALLNVF